MNICGNRAKFILTLNLLEQYYALSSAATYSYPMNIISRKVNT
jgi:hypothetical protein